MLQNCWDECAERCRGLGYEGLEFQYCVDGCGWPRCDIVQSRAITSARLRTFDKFSVAPSENYQTIRVEARINLPKAPGLWPAFWMLPEDVDSDLCSGCGAYGPWPLSGEIDVLESLNNMTETLGTVHFGNSYPNNTFLSSSIALPEGSLNDTGYQLYSLEWSSSSIRWMLNEQQYGYVTSDQWFTSGTDVVSGLPPGASAPFDKNFYLLLNMAVGGHLPENKYQDLTGTQLDLSTMQSGLAGGKEMLVDWIRVCGRP